MGKLHHLALEQANRISYFITGAERNERLIGNLRKALAYYACEECGSSCDEIACKALRENV